MEYFIYLIGYGFWGMSTCLASNFAYVSYITDSICAESLRLILCKTFSMLVCFDYELL